MVKSALHNAENRLMRRGMLPAAAICCLLLAGCAGTARMPESRSVSHSETQLEKQIRAKVSEYHGTPHRWGGSSRDGLDCSAFVQLVYDDLFGIRLPRTTEDQVRAGRNVSARTLQPGDLVFFRPGAKTNHVGIYLSRGQFAHVSSTQGVTVSDIDQAYWQQSYWTARRVLTERSVASAAPASEKSTAPAQSQKHIPPSERPRGW